MRSLILCLTLLGIGSGCSDKHADPWGEGTSPKVLVSFPPLYSLVASVGGDDIRVRSLYTTQGPHSHGDPAVSMLKLAAKSDVMFINGLGLDERLSSKLRNSSGNRAWNEINLGETIERTHKDRLHIGHCEHDHSEPGHEAHDHGWDPHIWLDIRTSKLMVEIIRDELARIDPAHKDGYTTRAKDTLARLDVLRTEGLKRLEGKSQRSLIAFHDSLNYFAECFDLKIAGAVMIEPGVEPGQKKLDQLVALCIKENIRAIAVEPQFPKNTSARVVLEALKAKGIDAVFVEVDPLETAASADLTPDLYEKVIRRNIDNLAAVLK